MQIVRKVITWPKIRSKTYSKILLVLCLMTLLGLLIAHKDKIIKGVIPKRSADKSYEIEMIEDYDYNDPENIIEQPNTKPKPVNTTAPPNVTPKPVKMLANSSYVPTKPPHVPINPQKVSTTLLDVSNKSLQLAANRPHVTIKGLNVTTATNPKVIARTDQVKQRATTTSYLGDKYATDDIHLSSKCPNRTRDMLQSKEFQNMFVETIPVLQWKKHAQESEYRRLQMYAGAQGWMGVTWKILNETLNLMNSTGNGYMFDNWKGSSSCIRCAVVGNAGILNGSGMGKEIDGHDYVFRVNGAITKGFEKDVGNRTSFFLFSTNTLMNSLMAYGRKGFKSVPHTEETRYVLLPDHDRDYLMVRAALTNSTIDRGKDHGKDPSKYFGKNLTTEHFKILHPDFMRYLRNRFLWAPVLNTAHRNIYRPSTGASMLLAAVHTCDQVNAYGFMTPNYQKFSDHYYDSTYHKVVFYMNHSFRKEMVLWQKLHKAGVIKLYMRD
ncbi:alpha-N-acetylgalactosaminide alpha-2,6-sialyltransferase 2-like [Mixophyes fleayi]|uniref:alpha-N-acetylgalactosaminide alpha-2,6-sialyltransferase 2-like n=1 Tax=Mixophyes fleayi TaxID=3061075 RepID=UPI003F4D840B